MIRTVINNFFRKLGYEIHSVPKKITSPQEAVLDEEQGDDFTRLRNEFRKYATIKLHFGSGPRVLKDWINIDLRYEHFANYLQYYTDEFYPSEIRGGPPDFIAFDVTQKPLPLADNSVDVVFHEDFIEHLSQKNQILFLAETCRVLKPSAIHRVNTPNLLISMRDHADFSQGYDGVYVDEWDKHVHLNVLTPAVLKELALMVGYSKVVFTDRDQSVSELIPREYRPDPHDRSENGNLFADLIK